MAPIQRTLACALLGSVLFACGCSDAGPPGEPVALDPWNDGDSASDGTADDSVGCVVRAPPARLHLDPFYRKYCSARGIPVVAAAVVPDAAVQYAARIVSAMVARMPNVQEAMARNDFRVGIIGASQLTTDMPEFAGRDPSLNERARGLADNPLVASAEENVLCYEQDDWRGENILVHEFSHAIKGMLEFYVLDVDPTFQARVDAAFDAAIANGLYRDVRDPTRFAYAGTNPDEYWAEGVQNYFNVHQLTPLEGGPVTSDDLRAYDPALFAVIDEVFDGVVLPPTCPTPPFQRDSWYRIENVFHGSGLALDGSTLAESGDFSGQAWRIRAVRRGEYRLTNAFTGDAESLTIVDGRAVMAASDDGAAQSWSITPIAQGQFRLTNVLAGPAQSLEADPGDTRVMLHERADRIVQRWKVTRLP